MRFTFAAGAASLALASTALAQPADGTLTPVSIVVQPTDAAAVHRFVSSVGAASPLTGVLARWADRICPGVTGTNADVAQAIIDQVARRANAVGLRTGAPGCAANLTIIVTNDSDRVAHDLYARRRTSLVTPNGIEGSTLGDAALGDFANTPRPIRWWHVAQTVTADGHLLSDSRGNPIAAGGTAALQETATGGDAVAANRTRSNGTRLQSSTRQDLNCVIIIVDTRRMNGAPVSAIADYVAFVSLAQVDPNVNASGLPSILNLFNEQDASQRPTSLTDWDIAYLDGLYHATRTAHNARQQQNEIARRMASSN
jgi:hypothetical protein